MNRDHARNVPGVPPPRNERSEETGHPFTFWVGLLVSVIVLILLLILVWAKPSDLVRPAIKKPPQASSIAGDSAISTGLEDSTRGNRVSEVTASKAPPVSDIAGNDENVPFSSDVDEVDTEAAFDAVVVPKGPPIAESNTIVESGKNEPKPNLRIRRLNVGEGFVPLVIGESNPLRIGDESKSVVYVIDKSSSMSGDSLARVCAAVCDAIERLDAHQEFSVILFDNEPRSITGNKLLPATRKNKMVTEQMLLQATASGGTQPYDAVIRALKLSPGSIVVLSDGDFDASDTLRITQFNHSKQHVVTIHTIGLQRRIETLRRLAEGNGQGTYTTAKVTRN